MQKSKATGRHVDGEPIEELFHTVLGFGEDGGIGTVCIFRLLHVLSG